MRHILKFLFAVALVLSFTGITYADGIPFATDPYNYPSVWIQDVYNGSGSDITSAVCVRWDCGASNAEIDDMGMWVEIVGTIADIRTAGVVPYGHPIDDGEVGYIIVKGPAIVYDAGNTTSAGSGVESDASGHPVDETLGATDEALLGWVIHADASSAANTDLDSNYCVIFVQPTPYSGD